LTGTLCIEPVLSLAMYLLVRGDDDGFQFLRYKETTCGPWEHNVRAPLKDAKIFNELRGAFDEAGDDAYQYIDTHSFKPGGVQLYRFFGVPDDEIKSHRNWSSFSGYTTCVQARNRLEKRFYSASRKRRWLMSLSAAVRCLSVCQ